MKLKLHIWGRYIIKTVRSSSNVVKLSFINFPGYLGLGREGGGVKGVEKGWAVDGVRAGGGGSE